MRRAEQWAGEVPDGVGVITGGWDVQDDRVEGEFVGWGHGEESWSLDHVVIEGDPATDELWERVDKAMQRRFKRADGREFTVAASCIDSGGHHTQRVYAFAKARLGRNVWAVKGQAARNGERSPVWPVTRISAANRSKFKPVIVGTNAAKDSIRNRLGLTDPGPGYMHFPASRDLGWYVQLVAERLLTKVIAGRRFTVWDLPKGKANEALDCRVYAYAALMGLVQRGLKLNAVTEAASAEPEVVEAIRAKAAIARAAAKKKPTWLGPKRNNWLKGKR